jgi:hypothetical protein
MKKLTTTALILAVAGLVMASEEDDLTSLSYIAYLERYATVQPASQQEGIEAVANMPLVPGDRIDTAREARMEVFLADGNTVWIDEYSTLSLDAVAFSRSGGGERTVLYLAEGTIMVEISEHGLSRQPVRIDGRAATVYLNDVGLYRVDALPSGGLRIEVWEGLGEASTTAGGVLVRAESAAEVAGGDVTGVESHVTWGDAFASWVVQRRQFVQGETSQYVDARYDRQSAQLDNYGTWVYLDAQNTWAWQPTVSADWRPYTAGRWYWTPSGWSWISYEPWGWLPYHYGSWHFSMGFGWVWTWHPYWSPAWVRWCWWPGYIGWSPWGYYDYWYWPRYHHYYGYDRWPYYPGYPGGGGAGHAQPRRRDVVPPASTARTRSTSSSLPEPGSRSVARTRSVEPSLDLNGRVRVGAIDRHGWNVVPDGDFASPHLSRLVQSGEVAMRERGDEMGVVMSRPLATAPPSRARPTGELERVFRDVELRSPQDLSPVMARSDNLQPEEAMRLVEPTTLAAASRRPTTSGDSGLPTLTTGTESPMYRSGATPSGRYSTLPEARPSSSSFRRDPVSLRNPFVTRSRPTSLVTPEGTSPSTSRGSTGLVRRPSGSRSVTGGSPPPTAHGSSIGSRPVIVPRTSPSRPSRRIGSSGSVSRPPSVAPPTRSTSPRSSARPSSPPTSRSSGARAPSAGRSSAPSSSARPSTGSASSSRSSSGGSSSRSSGASRRQ